MRNLRFISEHERTVTKKGLINLPDIFWHIVHTRHEETKQQTPDQEINYFHLVRTPDDKIIDICRGKDLAFLLEKHSISDQFEAVRMPQADKQGRFAIPANFIEHSEIPLGKKVLIHGRGSHFMIMTHEESKREEEELAAYFKKHNIRHPLELLDQCIRPNKSLGFSGSASKSRSSANAVPSVTPFK